MLRKMMYMTFTFFVLSVFTYQNVCHAHMNENPEVFAGHTTTRNAWNLAYHAMNAKYKIMDNHYNIFIGAKSAVENLNTIWSDHKRKLAAGKTATVENVTNAFITLVGALVTGGTSTVVTFAPTVFSTYGAVKAGVGTATLDFDLDKYEKAMNNSLSAMDAALATLNLTDPLYQTLYNAYLGACANHKITRSDEWNKIYKQAEINGAVNMSPFLTDEWYHQGPSQGTHVIYARGSWSFSDLEELHPCNGPCSDKHRTHWGAFDAHHTKCGIANNVDNIGVGVPTTYILKGRTFKQGCGRPHYDCPNAPDTWHKERTCTIVYTYADGSTSACLDAKGKPLEYRRCMGHTRDHDKSDNDSSPTWHNDDDEEANAGGSLYACGIHELWQSGDHSSTWICNESPCSNRQVPYCFDECPEAGNHGTATTPTTPAMVVCDIEGCQDSTSYNPDSSSAGLHAYCNECYQYKCTGGGHSWYPRCFDTTHTNANGDSCTVAGYECVSHTPVYPFSPSVSLNSQSYSPGGSVYIPITSAAPIYGAHLYVRVPGDTSRYGTQIGWFRGNNDRTTTTLPLSYTFPEGAASGTYKISLRVYPWDGNTWGTPSDLFEYVTVSD